VIIRISVVAQWVFHLAAIVLAELLPDALKAVEAEQVATYATATAAW
jgi:hypothetical protein